MLTLLACLFGLLSLKPRIVERASIKESKLQQTSKNKPAKANQPQKTSIQTETKVSVWKKPRIVERASAYVWLSCLGCSGISFGFEMPAEISQNLNWLVSVLIFIPRIKSKTNKQAKFKASRKRAILEKL